MPLVLPQEDVVALRRQLHDEPGATISVDLASQTVNGPDGKQYGFDIHPVRKKCLLEGLDDIERTRQYQRSDRRIRGGLSRRAAVALRAYRAPERHDTRICRTGAQSGRRRMM